MGMGEITYDLTGDPADFWKGVGGWFNDVTVHLSSLFKFDDSLFAYKYGEDNCTIGSGWRFLFIFEKVATAILVSFTVIAVRRRFRKN
jgi:hypothetical protein